MIMLNESCKDENCGRGGGGGFCGMGTNQRLINMMFRNGHAYQCQRVVNFR
jgi:hypothetical protein